MADFYASKNNYISFNQNYKCIGVSHQSGYMFYKTEDVLEKAGKPLPFTGQMSNEELVWKNCTIVERLFSTGLMMGVTRNDPRVVKVFRMTTKEFITQLRFHKTVVALKINKERLCVLLEDSIHIFDLATMRCLHTVTEIPLNTDGVIDMSSASGAAYIAYPESYESGMIHIFDASKMMSAISLKAHESKIACIKFNSEGNMMATASEKGTVIRVFSITNGNMISEFRRGSVRFVTTTSICFSADSNFLCSASNTETVHVYKLKKEENEEATSYMSWMSSLKSVTNYMPATVKSVSDALTGERSFAFARLPFAAPGAQVGITMHHDQQFVIVATLEGRVYAFKLLEDGGELPLIFKNRIGAWSETKGFVDGSENKENSCKL